MKGRPSPAGGPRLERHLVLVGFMGVGKTRLGGLVSRQLGVRLEDVDHRVEAAAGMTVKEIFKRFGETYFRDLEHCCLRRILGESPAVVATGGGAFTYARNRQLIDNLGISLWIDVDFDTILGRMSERGRRARPLLRDEGRARALCSARRPAYGRANFTVNVHRGEAAEAVAGRILELIRERNCVTS